MVIFDQEEVGAIERRNFRKGVTVENREKTKNVIMLVQKGVLIMKKPIICIIPECDSKGNIVVKKEYLHSIEMAGGVPAILSFYTDCKDSINFIDCSDGFLLTGGPDVNPLFYEEEPIEECGSINPELDKFEIELLSVIKRTSKPVLGICRGIQVINVALGGTLIQDLPTYKAKFGHNQKAKGTVLTHSVEVIKDTLLYDIVKKNSFTVNSFHHQACKKLGNGLIANALTLDGIIEAASLANHRFFLGVQWHPECLYGIDENATKIWDAFISACRK